MCRSVNKVNKSVVHELAEAISSFNLESVSFLLSDSGTYAIQNVDQKIYLSDKVKFLAWLETKYKQVMAGRERHRKLSYNIVQSMHSLTGSSVILFNEGRFPEFAAHQTMEKKSGLIIKVEKEKITGIEFCFLVTKTEYPFIYERIYLRPVQEA